MIWEMSLLSAIYPWSFTPRLAVQHNSLILMSHVMLILTPPSTWANWKLATNCHFSTFWFSTSTRRSDWCIASRFSRVCTPDWTILSLQARRSGWSSLLKICSKSATIWQHWRTSWPKMAVQLPFLDVLVQHLNKQAIRSMHRKPVFTSLYTRLDYFVPASQKIRLIKSAQDLQQICNNMATLKNILAKNGCQACHGRGCAQTQTLCTLIKTMLQWTQNWSKKRQIRQGKCWPKCWPDTWNKLWVLVHTVED